MKRPEVGIQIRINIPRSGSRFYLKIRRIRLHASNMTRKLKEMPEREQNAAGEEKHGEDKPTQKKKTKNSGKENACGCREHLILQLRNSLDKYRPKFSLDPDRPAEKFKDEKAAVFLN